MKNNVPITDLDLIKRLKAGDESAFKILFDQWFNKLYYFSFRYLKSREHAQEVVQDTLLQLWLTREKLDEQYPISPFLYTIARRLSLNCLRNIATSKSASERHFAGLKDTVNTTEEAVSLAELQRITDEALSLMPKQQQLVYRMSRIDGLSLDEIAAAMGILKNTVKKHLSEALKAIRLHVSSKYYHLFVFCFTVWRK